MFLTFGEKPKTFSFELDENGNPVVEYIISSELEKYLRLCKGSLLECFPKLTRRHINIDERKKLVQIGFPESLDTNDCLMLASEVKDLLTGNHEFYRYLSNDSNVQQLEYKKPNNNMCIPTTSNISHLDAVSQPTLVNRNIGISKINGRSFKFCCDDLDPLLTKKMLIRRILSFLFAWIWILKEKKIERYISLEQK